MNSRLAIICAVLLTSVVQFAGIFLILVRFEFGLRDVIISALHAAAYSFVISCLFCLPIQLMLSNKMRKKAFYILGYMVGFIIISGAIEIYTTIVLGWPLDKSNTLTMDETIIGIALMTILMMPLSFLSAYLFDGLARHFLRSSRLSG